MIKYLWRRYGINPLDQILNGAKKNRAAKICICWNRGMGDIPLGLYGLNHRITQVLPEIQITYLTREDLREGFELLQNVQVLAHPKWKRHVPIDLEQSLKYFDLEPSYFDLILEKPDPTNWLIRQRGKVIPKLYWDSQKDELCRLFGVDPSRPCVGVHVQTETFYSSFNRNWPLDYWKKLFKKIAEEKHHQILLFGFSPDPLIAMPGVIDLRGQTSLHQMLSLVKNHCQYLVLPDSGPLAMTYYLDAQYPIRIVSLWADPRHGVLKQRVASPNLQLTHIPLISPKKRDLSAVSVASVFHAMYT